jgi:hypothetical protein
MNAAYTPSKTIWFQIWFFAVFLCAALVHGATILLQAYVSTAIVDASGTPLLDGSIVQIIASSDNSISDPIFNSFGTNYLGEGQGAFPLSDGDILLGTTTINSSDLGSNGTFFSSEFTLEYPDFRYVYLRVFDSQGPLTGMIDWAVSSVIRVRPFFGVAEADFGGGFSTDQTDSFVVIPEPQTGSLMLMFMTALFVIRYKMRTHKGPWVSLPRNSPIDDKKDWL